MTKARGKKKILFVTGTRADFGKLKPLMEWVSGTAAYECNIFATGMHSLKRYGNTIDEIYKSGFTRVHEFINQGAYEPMELILANTIHGLSRYMQENPQDLVIVHGDRVETLAGAIAGCLRNTRVMHIEGGELSGTVDGTIRHAISKLAHIHLVANKQAAARLRQMGEGNKSIFIIGSPDIDIMKSRSLPSLASVMTHYEIPFKKYAIAVYHSVTTELESQREHAHVFVDALEKSGGNYVVIYPNNDEGTEHIFDAYARLKKNPRMRLYPSLRFESFLVLLKHCQFIIGNSSAGIREAPVYGVPTVNVGNRQNNRLHHDSIHTVAHHVPDILSAIDTVLEAKRYAPAEHFGKGQSLAHFKEILRGKDIWSAPIQKSFCDF